MEAKVGTTILFHYDGMEYEREIEDITVYKNYSWFGDLGFGCDVSFTIHGDLDKNKPVLSGLVIQVDGVGNDIHEYLRDGITFKAPVDKEYLLLETIAMLSADLFDFLYDNNEYWGWSEVSAEIISLAKRFEEELNWQEDDERDYIEELEKFEEGIRKKYK